jgi:hypothetical protein
MDAKSSIIKKRSKVDLEPTSPFVYTINHPAIAGWVDI